MPAVLTENLFIDVVGDANRLKQSKVIDTLIDGHVVGIAKYLGLKKQEWSQHSHNFCMDGILLAMSLKQGAHLCIGTSRNHQNRRQHYNEQIPEDLLLSC